MTENTQTPSLSGRKVAFLVATEGIEQVELTEPWKAVEEAGGEPVLLSTEAGTVQAFDHLDKADTFDVDVVVGSAGVDDYAALVLPGGVANPDALRMDAGGTWVDEEVVVDGTLVTSRNPGDLPAFIGKLLELTAQQPA